MIKILKDLVIAIPFLRQHLCPILAHTGAVAQPPAVDLISGKRSFFLHRLHDKIAAGQKVSTLTDVSVVLMYFPAGDSQHQTDIVFICNLHCSVASG